MFITLWQTSNIIFYTIFEISKYLIKESNSMNQTTNFSQRNQQDFIFRFYSWSFGIFRKSQTVSALNLDCKGSKLTFIVVWVLESGVNFTGHLESQLGLKTVFYEKHDKNLYYLRQLREICCKCYLLTVSCLADLTASLHSTRGC